MATRLPEVGASASGKGPNGRESETDMNLGTDRRQKPIQMELPLESRGEAPRVQRSGESRPATSGTERSGTAALMERVVEQDNVKAALKRVRQNKGSAGVDGMTVDELPKYLSDRTFGSRPLYSILSLGPPAGRFRPLHDVAQAAVLVC